MLKPEVPHSSLLLFPLPFHLLYKKLLIVAWCPLLLHHKHRTQHAFALHSAASVYKVRTQTQLGQGIPPRAVTPSASPSQISLIASPVQILIPSSPSTSFLDTLRAANFPVCRYLGMDYLHIWKNNFSWDSVCVVWQKKPTTYPHVRRKPSHTIREQNCWTNFLLFQPFWRSQFLLWLGVKWLKHGQKERSRFSCNAWTHFFIL